jgi:V8-like Glu-specific endopeptidase
MAVATLFRRFFQVSFFEVSIWCAAAILPAAPARAITIASGNVQTMDVVDTNPSDSSYLTTDGASMSGVVMIYVAGMGSCTGALLGDGTSILTAGHCVDHGTVAAPSAITIYFEGPGGLNLSNPYTATSIAVDPGFNGNSYNTSGFTGGQDLAVIQLNALAPASATEYQLDMEPATLGANTVLDGFGYCGTGMTGYETSGCTDVLRAGENDFGTTANLLSSATGDPFIENGSSNELIGQFYDSSDPSTNALRCSTSNTTGCTSSPYSPSDEVDISPGDSGGPALQDVGGTWEIVGVNDIIDCVNLINGDCAVPPSEYSSTNNSSFGQLFGDTSVVGIGNENLNFIETQIAPEPGTISLMLGALLASLLLRMRRSEAAPAEIPARQRRMRWRQYRG